jgi:hypothetical protein
MWAGPDSDGAFMTQAAALLAGDDTTATRTVSGEFAGVVMGEAERPAPRLEVPPGLGFTEPDHELYRWDIALDADDLIGLLSTFSWIITMADDARERLFDEARRLLRDLLGVEGDVTVDVTFRCDAWRSRRED